MVRVIVYAVCFGIGYALSSIIFMKDENKRKRNILGIILGFSLVAISNTLVMPRYYAYTVKSELDKQKAMIVLKKYYPNTYNRLIQDIEETIVNKKENQINSEDLFMDIATLSNFYIRPLLHKALGYMSDETAHKFLEVGSDILDKIIQKKPDQCKLFFKGNILGLKNLLGREEITKLVPLLDDLEACILTDYALAQKNNYIPKERADGKATMKEFGKLVAKVALKQKIPRKRLYSIFRNLQTGKLNDEDTCIFTRDLYKEMSQLPPKQAGDILTMLLYAPQTGPSNH